MCRPRRRVTAGGRVRQRHHPTPAGGVRPGPGASSWRVTVEEWERFPGDPVIGRFIGAAGRLPQWEQRPVFADEVDL